MNSIVKRCLVGVILALAATLPHYSGLHTSEAGLKLIADYEGCQLNAYQCSANVWTNGIGHTAGVKPGTVITERQVAVNLVADVLRVEQAIAVCMPAAMPQPVYDAVVSFAFNVGTGAACRSTLAFFINKHDWRSACEQLPRWVYVGGVRNTGLERRRNSERTYCLQGVNHA
ncbi:lysozyme [Yersinia ruckeri]|uniref:lysozyme n=1 Tax=Yersinia ruckeri TaxID=29486 RepID=UPI0011A0DF45|nr:lysozyme [Yersinia ruckeri]EKN3361003.1 lysozyme [Yersinia ruckeri]EKN4200800.1 lysozyme [Yersinia ruckeri]EKN4725445.1 lysozyme [Yersinia ruckeri]ELV7520333.1 lysozyme [Yersinia ruckeri]